MWMTRGRLMEVCVVLSVGLQSRRLAPFQTHALVNLDGFFLLGVMRWN